jgi:hypothetical protein
MIPHINVPGPRVETWILGKMDSTLAIAKQIVLLLLHVQLLQEVLHPEYFLACINRHYVLNIYG